MRMIPAISSPEEGDAADEIVARPVDAAPHIDEKIDEARMLDRLRLLEAPIGHLVEQDLLVGVRIGEIRRQIPRCPSSCRVRSRTQAPSVSSLWTLGEIEDDVVRIGFGRDLVREPLDRSPRARPSSTRRASP